MQLPGRNRGALPVALWCLIRPDGRPTARGWLWLIGLGLLALSIPCGLVALTWQIVGG